MQIIRHLDLRLPFRLCNPSTSPAGDQTATSSPSGNTGAITPEPDSPMAPPSSLEELKSEFAKPPWQEYMEAFLSDAVLQPNRIERGILRIIHKMLSSPPIDEHAAQHATQEVRDFWAYLYKKYVTKAELLRTGGERLQKLRMEDDGSWLGGEEVGGVDYRGAGYFLEHAAGFVLEMAPMIDLGDVNHGRIFRFLEGFRDGTGSKNLAVRFFDHKNPKFIYDPHAIGRAATVVWKYTCPSIRSGINPSREECDGRSAFSALLARLLSADLLPLQKAALLVHDIDLAVCPDFFTDLQAQAQAQTQKQISSSSSSSSSSRPLRGSGLHIRPPAEIPTYIIRCRELIAARNILIAGQALGSYGLTYADQEVALMLTQLDGTVLKVDTNIPDWKWTMWMHAFGQISIDAKDRADKALGSDEVLEGLGSFGGAAGGALDDNDTNKVTKEHGDDDCDKGFLGQKRNIELGICAEKACLRLQGWIGAMENLKEQEQEEEQVVVVRESEETFEVTVPVQEQEEQQQQYFFSSPESASDDSDDMKIGQGVVIVGQDEDEVQNPGYITLSMEDLDFWSNLPGF